MLDLKRLEEGKTKFFFQPTDIHKLIDEVKKMITIAGADEVTVINSATINPATYLGLGNKLGLIKENYDADLIVIDDDYQVKQTYQKGIAKL